MKLKYVSYLEHASMIDDAKQSRNRCKIAAAYLKAYGHFSNIDMLTFAHCSTPVAWLLGIVMTVTQIRLLRVIYPNSLHAFELHRFFYHDFLEIDSRYIVNYSGIHRLVVITFVYQLCKALISSTIVHMNQLLSTRYRLLTMAATLIGVLNLIDATGLCVLIATVCTRAIRDLSPGYAVCGFFSIVLFAYNFGLHLHFSKDIRFEKQNRFQGKSYRYLALRVASIFFLACSVDAIGEAPDVGVYIVFAVCHFINGLFLLSYQMLTMNFLGRGILMSVFPVLDIFYVWESFLAILALSSQSAASADLDLLTFFFICLAAAAYRAVFFYKSYALAFLTLKKIVNPSTAYRHISIIYEHFRKGHQSNKHRYSLSCIMTAHIKDCCNPYCLCFLSKVYYDPAISNKSSRTLKIMIQKNVDKIDKFSQQHSISLFNEPEVIRKLKDAHTRVTRFDEENAATRTEENFDVKDQNRDSVMYLINFNSHIQFCRILCSFFVQLQNQIKKSRMELFYSMVSFFLYDYRNYIATLILLYQAKYSGMLKKHSCLFQQIRLQNYISTAKVKLAQETTRSQGDRVDLWLLMRYRDALTLSQIENRAIFFNKIDYYRDLSKQTIDYKKLISSGDMLYKRMLKNQRLILSLGKVNILNASLINEMIFFEICVLERLNLIPSTKKAFEDYSTYLASMKLYERSFQGKKKRLNYYNSSNVVLFADCLDHRFKIAKASSNASELLKMPKLQLLGLPIRELTPEILKGHHDAFILQYINGTSKSMYKGNFESTAKLGGRL